MHSKQNLRHFKAFIFRKAINLNNFLTLGQNPRWLSAPCEHSERQPPVFVWSHHSLLLYRSLKLQNRARVQLSGSHISNYYESHAYMQVHVLTTDWVKYRTNTKTSNVSWLTDIGRDGVHRICIANNRVTCITRA